MTDWTELTRDQAVEIQQFVAATLQSPGWEHIERLLKEKVAQSTEGVLTPCKMYPEAQTGIMETEFFKGEIAGVNFALGVGKLLDDVLSAQIAFLDAQNPANEEDEDAS